MTIIFMDEGGYTHENLMDAEQPFFTLATLYCSEQECQDYVDRFFDNISPIELKYKKLMRRKRYDPILKFLEEIAKSPELVKIWACRKRYELTKRIVQFLVVPAAKQAGVDLRIKGQDLALTNGMYNILPDLAGKDFFDDLLSRFQKMMVCLNYEYYTQFFSPLFNEQYPKIPDFIHQKLLDICLDHIKVAHTTIGYALIDKLDEVAQSMGVPRRRPLDVVFPGAIMLMQKWRKEVTDDIFLIHDKSKRMAEVLHLWNTIFHHNPPPAIRRLISGTGKSAIGIVRTSEQDSEVWRGIQLADILVGATRSWADWLLAGRKPEDSYGASLDPIMVKLQPIPNWPVPPVMPEYFEKMGLTEEEARAQDELGEKLTAFHNIRAYGYTYRIFPEEDE